MFLPGEIVIAAFPFSSLTTFKRRPCVVLAAGDTQNDFVVAFITKSPGAAGLASAIVIDPGHPGWKQTGLKVSSVLRPDKLVTLSDSVISGAIGVLPPDLLAAVRANLKKLFQTP